MVEPWLRGTHKELAPVQRAVVHALELAGEDVRRWCFGLSAAQMERASPGIPAVGFQVRHLARSLDRLLTYAEDRPLTETQLAALRSEQEETEPEALRAEFETALAEALRRVQVFRLEELDRARGVGRDRLPTTVAGLLIHVAEHTQRHVGQAITTAKFIAASR